MVYALVMSTVLVCVVQSKSNSWLIVRGVGRTEIEISQDELVTDLYL